MKATGEQGADVGILREEGWKTSREHIVALQSANQQLQLRLAHEIDAGKNSGATLQSQNAALQEEVARLANLLTQKNILLNGQVRETDRSKDEVEKYRDLMEGKLAEVSGKVNAYETLVAASEKEKTALSSTVERSKIELEGLRMERDELKSEGESKDSELLRLQALCKDQEKELHDFKTRKVGDVEKMLRHEIDAMAAKHTEELEIDRNEKERLKGTLEDLKDDRDGGKRQILSLQREVTTYKTSLRRLGEELRNVANINGANVNGSMTASVDSISGFTTLLEMSRDVLNESEGSVLIGDLMGDEDEDLQGNGSNGNNDPAVSRLDDTDADADADGTVVNYARDDETTPADLQEHSRGSDNDNDDDKSESSEPQLPPQPDIQMADCDTQTDPSPLDPKLQRQFQQLTNDNTNLAAELASMRNRNGYLTTANNELSVTTRRMEAEWKSMNMERVEKDGMVRKLQSAIEAMKGELDAISVSEAEISQAGRRARGDAANGGVLGEVLRTRVEEMKVELHDMTNANAMLRQEVATQNVEVEGWKEENLGLCGKLAVMQKRVEKEGRKVEAEKREVKVEVEVEKREMYVQTEQIQEQEEKEEEDQDDGEERIEWRGEGRKEELEKKEEGCQTDPEEITARNERIEDHEEGEEDMEGEVAAVGIQEELARVTRERDDLVEEFESAREAAKEDLEKFKQTSEEKEVEIKKLQGHLQETKERAKGLESEIEALEIESEVGNVLDKGEEIAEEAKMLREELGLKEDVMKKLTVEIAQLKMREAETRAEMKGLKERGKDLEKSLEEMVVERQKAVRATRVGIAKEREEALSEVAQKLEREKVEAVEAARAGIGMERNEIVESNEREKDKALEALKVESAAEKEKALETLKVELAVEKEKAERALTEKLGKESAEVVSNLEAKLEKQKEEAVEATRFAMEREKEEAMRALNLEFGRENAEVVSNLIAKFGGEKEEAIRALTEKLGGEKEEAIRVVSGEVSKLRSELNSQATDFQQEQTKLCESHEEEMESVSSEHKTKVKTLQSRLEKEIDNVKAVNKAKMDKLRKEKDDEIKAVGETMQGKIDDLLAILSHDDGEGGEGAEVEGLKRGIVKFEREIAEAGKIISRKEAELKRVVLDLEEERERREKAEVDIEIVRGEARGVEEVAEVLRKEKGYLRRGLGVARGEFEGIKFELRSAREESESSIRAGEEKVKAKIDELKRVRARAEKKMGVVREEIEVVRKELRGKKEELEGLRKELEITRTANVKEVELGKEKDAEISKVKSELESTRIASAREAREGKEREMEIARLMSELKSASVREAGEGKERETERIANRDGEDIANQEREKVAKREAEILQLQSKLEEAERSFELERNRAADLIRDARQACEMTINGVRSEAAIEVKGLERKLELVRVEMEGWKREEMRMGGGFVGASLNMSAVSNATNATNASEASMAAERAAIAASHETSLNETMTALRHEKETAVKEVRARLQNEKEIFARALHAKLQAEHLKKIKNLQAKHKAEVERLREEMENMDLRAAKAIEGVRKDVGGLGGGVVGVREVKAKYREKIRRLKAGWEEEKKEIVRVVKAECDVILKRTERAQGLHDRFLERVGKLGGGGEIRVEVGGRGGVGMSIRETDKFLKSLLEEFEGGR